MDSRQECIEIIKRNIVFPDNEIQFIEGEDLEITASIDIKNATIVFPRLQEAFLILDELGYVDDFMALFFAVCMLRNDDYILCDKLLTKLEGNEKPDCSIHKELYNNILNKQIFIILHECGHYFSLKYDELRKDVCDCIIEFSKKISYKNINKNDVRIFWDKAINNLCPDKTVADFFSEDVYNYNINYEYNIEEYVLNPFKLDESVADMIALTLYKHIWGEKNIEKKTKLSILNGVLYVDIIKELTDALNRGLCEETIGSMANNMADTARFHILFQGVDGLDGPPIIDDNIRYYFSHMHLCYLIQFFSFPQYIESWDKGNDNPIDLSARRRLSNRIIKYAESLKQIYNTHS